jgi:hypothetical protein
MSDSTRVIRPPQRARPPTARTAAAVIATAILALLAAACGGGGSSTGSVGSSHAGGSSSSRSAVAFARCMRGSGVQDYPDPTSKVGSGGVSGSDLDPFNPIFEAAYQACQSLLPPGQETLQQMHHQLAEEGLYFARCMRAHGITNFPDPNADGQFPETQMRGLGKGSPQFTAAQNACERYLSPRDGGGGTK